LDRDSDADAGVTSTVSTRQKFTVLVADDEPAIVRLIASELGLAGYDVVVAEDGEAAVRLAQTLLPDLIVLDIMMPKRDGFSVCCEIREFSSAPILVLSARGREQDKVNALRLGADDYMTKPFGVAELLARVHAAIRRSRLGSERAGREPVRSGGIEIDFASHLVKKNGVPVKLTSTEYKLLRVLAARAGRAVTHDALLTAVWGAGYTGQVEYLWVYVGRLRTKLEDDPNHPKVIETVSGRGYRFNANF
jgi:two-component system KDP operon response regulator KdpE